MKTLIVGCGLKPKTGCVNLDKVALPGVDCVFDLDAIQQSDSEFCIANPGKVESAINVGRVLPFFDSTFDRIEAEDVLEHCERPIDVVQDLGRVLKTDGVLWIRGPDDTMVWHDLTHKRAFSERTFDGFDPETYDGKHYGHYYGSVKFKMLEKKLINHGWEYWLKKRR